MPDRPHLPPFAALRAFEAYGRHGKVRRAATALGVSHAIVSRHLHALEDWLGVALIDRAAGCLTPAGAAFHASIANAFDQIGAASEVARGEAGRRLEVTSVPGIAYHWLTARLPEFAQAHPEIGVTLRPADSPPDVSAHVTRADIRWWRDGEATTGNGPITRVPVIRPRVFPVARPDAPWLRDRPIACPADLLALPLLHEDIDIEWRIWFAAHGEHAELPPPAARLWQAHMTLAAARDGQGVALTNAFLAGDDLAAGRVVELGAGIDGFHAVSLGSYYLTTHGDSARTAPLRQFRAWLEAQVAATPADWQAGPDR